MRRFKIVLVLLFLLNIGCEEVVDIDLEESEPRLVVEASLLWTADSDKTPQYIRLTTTAPYFDKEVPPAKEAEVTLYDSEGREYFFEEVEPGIFRNEGFTPVPDENYELEIIYEEEIYRATSSLVPVPQLENIEQNDNGGFSGEEIELRAYYEDPNGIDNFYLFHFYHNNMLGLQIADDVLTDGNLTYVFFSDEDLEAGDDVHIEIQGISKRFYEYMYILRSQAGTGEGPFQTQPTTVRGNVVNTTNPDNFAFGYFRMSGSDVLSYTIE